MPLSMDSVIEQEVQQEQHSLLSDAERELSVGAQVPPRALGERKARENKQISLWLHRAADQVPSALLPADGQQRVLEAV